MALIRCPSCNKRTSDKAKQCSHCDFVLAGRSQEELDRAKERAQQRRKEKLLSQSMLALLIAIAAFAYIFLEQPHEDSWYAKISYSLLFLGLLWFLVNRVRLLMNKRDR